jgi:hypothetical protein
MLTCTAGPILRICASVRENSAGSRNTVPMLSNLPYDFGKKAGRKILWAA